ACVSLASPFGKDGCVGATRTDELGRVEAHRVGAERLRNRLLDRAQAEVPDDCEHQSDGASEQKSAHNRGLPPFPRPGGCSVFHGGRKVAGVILQPKGKWAAVPEPPMKQSTGLPMLHVVYEGRSIAA